MNPETAEKVEKVFALFGVETFFGLQRAYSAEDQRLMKGGLWDDQDASLLTNWTKAILELIDPTQLDPDDQGWRQEILWFWYHHAISCAIWKRKDRGLAQLYAENALKLQASDHPNQITRLLWYLVHDQLQEAQHWAEQIIEDPEHTTAQELIDEHVKGGFF
ncbi:MAG: hypothetical protein Q8P93_01560 [bacterium]|nr:hypothetical protein [bacterium]